MKLLFKYMLTLGACCTAVSMPLQAAQRDFADYVVVGMGAAGAEVAKLLSDDHHTSVIGLEAGINQDSDKPIKDSTLAPDLESSYYATYFYQQEQLPEAFNGEQYHYTTGYLWGGGSSINGEQYVQGSNQNYKRWERLLGDSWSVKRIRRAFKKFENYNGHTTNSEARGYHGSVNIRQAPNSSTKMADKLVHAIQLATGFHKVLDYNNPKTPIGPFSRWQLYQKPNGRRESSSTAFLRHHVDANGQPKGARKLTIISKASVQRVLFNKHKKAIGVAFEQEGQCRKVFAKKKVILCAGVFSPKLLMLSGIGPRALLEEKGIAVVADNSNVGKNLSTHPMINAVFTANPDDPSVPKKDLSALYVGGAFLPHPSKGRDTSKRGVQLIGMSPESGSLVVSALLLDPESRGEVNVQSNDPLKPVLATDAILDNKHDLKSFKDIFRVYIKKIAIKLAEIDPKYQLVTPSIGTINDNEMLTDFIKENVDVAHHWTGSCRMAPKKQGGVVNKRGHVYGVHDLVIADASIAPYPNDGNTSAPAFVIGRIIAEQLIKSEK